MSDGISIRAENLQFDGRLFTTALNEEMGELFIEATRAFLIAATRRIPIRTGFLRGAFTRLEDVVGAFETSASVKARLDKARSGPRPGKDLASTANRVVRLRQRQNNILKQIKKLQQREANRRAAFTRKVQELEKDAQGKTLDDKKLRALLAGNRAVAIRQRRFVRSLIRQAQANESGIDRAFQAFKKKFESDGVSKLRSEANDSVRRLSLRDAVLQQKRNEAFQNDVKRLNQSFFGKKGVRPQVNSNVPNRLPFTSHNAIPSSFRQGHLDKQTFDRRLNKLREKIGRPSKTQVNLRTRIGEIQGSFVTKQQQTELENFARKLAKKYGERIRQAKQNDEEELELDLIKQLDRKLQRARKRINDTNREDHPVLAQAQKRLARAQRLSDAHIEHLRQQLNSEGEHINVLARTTRGRIVGQNSPGKFNLLGSERVKKTFNTRDKAGNLINERKEYYYPLRGNPGARVLKTPRAGRRFATPANNIIVKTTTAPTPNLSVFRQLAGFVKASGVALNNDLQQALNATGQAVTDYVFNFAVDISYLGVNDARLAWESWQAGVTAFNYVINTKGVTRLPKLTEFTYVVVRAIKPGQSTPTVQTRTVSGRG